LVLGWGFQGRRIKWLYFRFDQAQGGGRPPSLKFRRNMEWVIIEASTCMK